VPKFGAYDSLVSITLKYYHALKVNFQTCHVRLVREKLLGV
jgi:hypothetical protein